MQTRFLLLIGAGGHAKVIVDAIRIRGAGAQIMIRDDNPALKDCDFLGLRIQTPIDWRELEVGAFHVAIGDNITRERIYKEGLIHQHEAHTIIHPRATISALSQIGAGAFVAANAVIAPDARIGNGVIVNHSAIVDHDCTVGAFSHLGPGSLLGGGATVGRGSLVGAGAVVLPGRTIGDYAVVGAGAVVTQDVTHRATVVGIPARVHKL